jgi:aspartate kinase
MSRRPLIVQKYGGTSVGSPELIRKVAARIARLRARGVDVAVVVSAMGDHTDRLVDLAREVSAHPHPRELDSLLSTGEQVSVSLLAMALHDVGVPARSLVGFQVPMRTTAVHGKARIEGIDGQRLAAIIAEGAVPVVAGFQGINAAGDITTIGRGGSDTTAVAVAVALGADECQILTDVDGVYTTDPRMVPAARRLPRLTFEEMLELAGQGARVLHLRAVEFAAKYNVKLRVALSFEDSEGTLITAEDTTVEAPLVAGIAFNRDEAAITVTGLPDQPGAALAVLEPVSEANIEVDMIVLNAPREGRVDLTFTVHRDDHAAALAAVQAAVLSGSGTALAGSAGVRVTGDTTVAKLSVVGVGMRSHAGVATRLFATLAAENINVRLVATSEIKVSVLVDEHELERGVRALHAAYGLEKSPTALST